VIIYLDVLIVLNVIIDYFLLKVTAGILKRTPKLWRILTASLAGGLSSLCIFLPLSGFLAEFAVNLGVDFIIAFACFGFGNVKSFLKAGGVFFGVICLYAGIMMALWQILRPEGMIVNNSVVYFNISPIVLIGFTIIGYFGYILFSKIFASTAECAKECELTIYADGGSVGATAIIDTGNSITDLFGKNEIIIVDKSVLKALFGEIDIEKNPDLRHRYRKIPCGTVAGADVLDGFRCEKAGIVYEGREIHLQKPIAAISKIPLKENYSAILNPKIFETTGECDEDKKLMV